MTLNHNAVFYKLVMRENKKRKTNQASSFRAPLEAAFEEDEDAFWNNLEIEDKPRGEELAAQEEAT